MADGRCTASIILVQTPVENQESLDRRITTRPSNSILSVLAELSDFFSLLLLGVTSNLTARHGPVDREDQ